MAVEYLGYGVLAAGPLLPSNAAWLMEIGRLGECMMLATDDLAGACGPRVTSSSTVIAWGTL